MFRLMNVLFSADFRQRLADLATSRSRAELDGPVSKDTQFWSDVQEVFSTDGGHDCDLGKLQFEHFALKDTDLDLSVIVPHQAKKLRSMYADVQSRHKVAVANFTKSGTHSAEFFDFCRGQLDVLYLHLYVKQYPSMTEVVTAIMPEHLRVDTGNVEDAASSRAGDSSTGSNGRRRSNGDRVIAALESLNNSCMRTELAKRKLEEYDSRMRERTSRMQERASKKHASHLQQLQLLGSRVRDLIREANAETCDEIKADIVTEINMLKAERKRLEILIREAGNVL